MKKAIMILLDKFAKVLKYMILDGLSFTDYIFDNYIPGFSTADLGFTKA